MHIAPGTFALFALSGVFLETHHYVGIEVTHIDQVSKIGMLVAGDFPIQIG